MREQAIIHHIALDSRKEVVKVKPLMDLHKGAKTCDLKAFKEFIKDRDEFTYFVCNGDLWDMIFFNDKRFRPSGHDKSGVDDAIDEEVDEMEAILHPIKDHIIGIGTGNHEDTIEQRCGTNPSKRLAKRLGVPYMGYSWWFRMAITRPTGGVGSVDFFVSHGFGGGTRTEGGSITKYAKFADRFLCDVFIVGHDHRKQYVKYPVLGIHGIAKAYLYGKSKTIVLGGSWKKTYGMGTVVTWEESKGFPPSELGGVCINIKPAQKWVKVSVEM